jgi:carbon-monoxide dehydrogenase medium subunit
VKPSAFDYVRPGSVEDVLAELARESEDTKVLAGGQSLVPMMNLRLARPGRLVDINAVPGLEGVSADTHRVVIGSRTRHLDVQEATVPGPLGSLLQRSARHIGHLPIRTRGTFGGSLAHSDPASEWCLLVRLLDATVTVRSAERGGREIRAEDLFVTMFTTSMEPDELLVDVTLPALDDRHRTGMAEFARRAGDFAIVAVMADVAVDDDGLVTQARICVGGVGDVPHRSAVGETLLVGERLGPELVHEAAEAVAAEVTPPSDAYGDSDYRRDLVRALLPRAVPGGQQS